MALYDFKCPACGSEASDVVLSIKHEPKDRPHCCEQPMEVHITAPPMVHWRDYDVCYKPISVPDAEPITSRRQEKEFLKRNGLRHAEFDVPTQKEQQRRYHEEVLPSIEAISPPKDLNEQAKRQIKDMEKEMFAL